MCKPKDMVVAFIGAFIGILIVEFTLGWVLMGVFAASPIYKAAGIAHLFGYIIGAAIIFGIIYPFLADAMKIRKRWLSGLKLGGFYGVIVMLPWAMMAFFLTTLTFDYISVAAVYGIIEYAVAGLIAMPLLAKFGTKK